MKPFKLKSIAAAYQPIVNTRSREIMGYEALARGKGAWSSPEKMFSHAYEHGYTVELDHTCLKKSLEILPKLEKKQLLFVNVEPMTFCTSLNRSGKLHGLIKNLPQRKQIVFELTEGLKTRDLRLLHKSISYLKNMGCKYALDDVKGIGLKLFELLSLKPDFIKMDIFLTKGLSKDPFSRWTVHQLLDFCKGKTAQVIAEGVENVEECRLVTKLGIPYSQGFYFARPKRELLRKLPIRLRRRG